VTPDSRTSLAKSLPIATSSIKPPSKLDIHERNQYNRSNHSNRSINLNNNNNTISNRLISSSNHHYTPQHTTTHHNLDTHIVDDLGSYQQPTLQLSPTKSYYYRSRSSQNSQSSSSTTTSTSTSNQYTNSSSYYNYHNNRYLNEIDPYVDDQTTASDSRRFTERRKKTVRFDGQDSDEFSRWENERQGSQDSTTKDSGIDTSSTFTSSEDSNRGDIPKVFTQNLYYKK
jgi:hypothetical protein